MARPLRDVSATSIRKDATANQKRKYFEHLAKDLMDPTNVRERATRRFDLVLRVMETSKKGQFLLPVQPGDHRGIVAWWPFRKWPGPRQ